MLKNEFGLIPLPDWPGYYVCEEFVWARKIGEWPRRLVGWEMKGYPLITDGRLSRKTRNRGSACGSSKLTADDVLEIKELLRLKISQYTIAEQYEVTRSTINDIARKYTWAWLEAK